MNRTVQGRAYPKPEPTRTRPGVQAPAPTGSMMDRAAAVFGFDPYEEVKKLREAQARTFHLREREAKLVANLASYEARFSYPSHFEHERKGKLSVIVEQRRAEARRAGEKITESALDSYAHSHLEYQQFLDRALAERKEMERLRAELVEVRGQIETARAAEVFFEKRSRISEALIYHSGKEVGA